MPTGHRTQSPTLQHDSDARQFLTMSTSEPTLEADGDEGQKGVLSAPM